MADHPYASGEYARALGYIGRSIPLAEWGAFVVARPISTGGEDAVGPYPLTVFADGADIGAGLAHLRQQGLVSVVLVPDPFASPDHDVLAKSFHVCRPFKKHAVIDLTISPYNPTRHHRDRIRRGHRRCAVQIVNLSDRIEVWENLYRNLIDRHSIAGAALLSPSYFSEIANDKRFITFEASVGPDICGMTIWFEFNGIGYSHLTAFDAKGYANGAGYALNDAAITHFQSCTVINLGGGAGLTDAVDDGLLSFKRGFANRDVTALLCGAILDETQYERLSVGREADFFPIYRGPR